MNLPKELRYTEEHEWVKTESDNKVRVGITDFAQSELGDIVFVELPEVGDKIEAGQPFGSVESVKTVSELYAPVNGTIVEVNSSLEESPENVNDAPYEDGWMIVVELENTDQLKELLSDKQYKESIQ
ncbi:glycine cleavage system protein GcvH [Thermoactinomyces sp. DSM 45892]|uniref:glycine cleavage system protein GcvH n=1 Tax=Thermoactinomyces sp. DSM 45892 TaxID=1882753 RepID=UPI000894D1BD|nr:glycine cleavage system protein GcvH [Thermoactinomyces sp. DSM 45892]SDY16660.1 glycine cleavage system H protein [Thermoactinomyces sp. DSM 45892]